MRIGFLWVLGTGALLHGAFWFLRDRVVRGSPEETTRTFHKARKVAAYIGSSYVIIAGGYLLWGDLWWEIRWSVEFLEYLLMAELGVTDTQAGAVLDVVCAWILGVSLVVGYLWIWSGFHWVDQRIRGTTWGLVGYTWFHLSLLVFYGGGGAIFITGMYAASIGNAGFLAALAIGLIVLNAAAPLGARILWRARRVQSGEWWDRLGGVASRLRIPRPSLYVIPHRGSMIAIGFAAGIAPGRRGVFLTDHLVSNLEPEEVEAIMAHEVAHLANHDLWKYMGGQFVLGLAIYALHEVSRLGADLAFAAILLHYAYVFPFLSRRCERDADRCAVRACSRPEALVSGLERLHELAYLPRVVGRNEQARMTHPMMAKRAVLIRREIALVRE